MPERTISLPHPVDLRSSLGPLRVGAHDPTMQLGARTALRALRTPLGPATVLLRHTGDRVEAEAWGEGADWALDAAPGLAGVLDDHTGFDPTHPLVRDLHRRAVGLRLPRTGRVLEALVPSILGQKATGFEARRSFRQLVERWGEPAPGPGGLRLPPAAATLAELGYYDLHVVGVEKKRADTLKRAGALARGLEAAGAIDSATLRARLESVPGIGPWTSAEVARLALGDADAVSVGDFHLKHLVCFALAGEPRGTDERMLALLEPFAGHRGRVCLLLERSGLSAPKYGPKQRIQPLARR